MTGRDPSAISTRVGLFAQREVSQLLQASGHGFRDQLRVPIDLAGGIVRPRPEEAA